MPLTVPTNKEESVYEKKPQSNYENIVSHIDRFPGLRFYQLKKETGIANGTLQHHLSTLTKLGIISTGYDNSTPRYFSKKIESNSQIIIKRLSQNTTSQIIRLLLKKECQTFAQLVKNSKKSPGTVSLYKNKLVADKVDNLYLSKGMELILCVRI